MIKFFTFLGVLLFIGVNTYSQSTDFFQKADNFLEANVQNGLVNYRAIKERPEEIQDLIKMIAESSWSEENEKAYLINVYNIGVINKVRLNYPIQSTEEVAGFFDRKDLILNGEKVSLNYLENELLRKNYEDSRFHFVLVCGAIGCPNIEPYAYFPETLESTLYNQTSKALNQSSFLKVDTKEKKVLLSEIFKWFAEDFGEKDKEKFDFINGFVDVQIPEDYKIEYYPYDWTLNDMGTEESVFSPEEKGFNLQTFTGGSLLAKGQMDFTMFNTIYTETKSNWQGTDFTGFRSTFVTHLFQYTVGIDKSKRINLGLDINFKSSATSSDDSFSSIGNAFAYKNNDSTRVGITSLGMRVKLQPFKNVPDFTVQSTLTIPIIENPEGFSDPAGLNNLYWADWDRITWWNQFFVSKVYGKFQVFAEADILFRFKRYESQIGMLDLPLNFILSYFPTHNMTFYTIIQHVSRFTNNINPQNPNVTDWVIPMNYSAAGLGFKYNITSALNLELLYTNFWRGKNSGLGSTYNIGIKYIY